MKLPIKIVPLAFAVGLLSCATASAGTYTNDFSSYGLDSYSTGGANGSPGAFIDTNRLILGINQSFTGGQTAGSTLYDFDNGSAIEAFTAVFKLQLGPGSGNPADGVSFNFGPSAAVYDFLASNEEGPGTPGSGVFTISFDTYDNGLAAEQVPTPSVDIKFNGNVIAGHYYAKSDMVTSQLEDVKVQVTRAGLVSVWYKGQQIHTNVFVPGWAPIAGRWNLSGRCGGEYEYQAVANLGITTVLQGAAVAPTVTANPQSVTVNEGGVATFSVAVDGSAPFTFQWYKNNVAIQDATNATLTINPVHFTDNNASIKCTVSNSANSATSGNATLTVTRDTTPPTVVKAIPNPPGTQLFVTYSEPVSDTALTMGNYSINQGITISGVTRVSASQVQLNISTLPGGQSFILTINNVQDMASSPPNTIAANTHVTFNSYLFQTGAVIHKKYTDPTPNNNASFAALQTDPRYPNNPDRQDVMGTFEYPIGGSGRDAIADPGAGGAITYSDTLETYFIPPTTGDYIIYAEGADINDVWLSTDSDPANVHNVAQCSGWTNPRDWLVSQCGTANGLRSDTYTGNTWPGAGAPLIHLTAGTRYYMIAFHHRFTWSGGDEFGVTFKLSGQADPVSGEAPALTGSVVGTYLDATGASINFVQQPADTTVLQGRRATLRVVATGQSAYGTNETYQWQSAPSGSSTFTDIAGATAASYTTPVLGLADTGTKYQVRVSVPGLSQLSTVATVTVIADTIPPQLATAAAIASQAGGTMDVGITFDEPVTQASAETLSHYSIAGATISAVKYYPQSPGVVLTVSGLGSGASVSVTGIADPYGNTMSTASMAIASSTYHWGVVGADELGLGSAVLATGANNFDVYSDGIGEWGTYDETTFVYEQVTGDFDKELRVEYQDPSSQWARAGLIARDVTNFGVDRATQGTQAGRYQKIHVNPVTTAMGTPGNNSYEGNRRLTTGGATDNIALTSVLAPAYPNAWCRMTRTNQTFTVFRSSDGLNWVNMGSTTFPDPGMPATLYVGPEFSPENGNVTAALQGVFAAKFRDYRAHSNVVQPPTMTYVRTPSGMTITFQGTLQSAPSLNGPWSDMTGTPSPYVVPVTGTQSFYRSKF